MSLTSGQARSSLFRRKEGRLGSSWTHGSLSSVQIAATGGMFVGSSSEATVRSIRSESTPSWINRGVPQQDANERKRSAYRTLRTSPLRISIALPGTLHQVTYGAALARRQSSQWQSLPGLGFSCRRKRTAPHKHPPSIAVAITNELQSAASWVGMSAQLRDDFPSTRNTISPG